MAGFVKGAPYHLLVFWGFLLDKGGILRLMQRSRILLANRSKVKMAEARKWAPHRLIKNYEGPRPLPTLQGKSLWLYLRAHEDTEASLRHLHRRFARFTDAAEECRLDHCFWQGSCAAMARERVGRVPSTGKSHVPVVAIRTPSAWEPWAFSAKNSHRKPRCAFFRRFDCQYADRKKVQWQSGKDPLSN